MNEKYFKQIIEKLNQNIKQKFVLLLNLKIRK